jgi:predicted dehydrogenase
MSSMRLGIIGMGNMGTDHAKKLTGGAVPEIVLTAVADKDEKRLEAARAYLPDTVAMFDGPEALMNSGLCDAVIVATPHYDHPTLAIQAFERGLHVMVEKPAGYIRSRSVK